MKSIETIANVSSDGKLTAQLPSDVPPGNHRVIVVIDETPAVEDITVESQLSSTSSAGDAWDIFNALLGMVDGSEEWAVECED